MASMGIYDYELLEENEKADVLWEKGTFLSSRTEGKMKYNLSFCNTFAPHYICPFIEYMTAPFWCVQILIGEPKK
jgi:hypothetical protein